MVYSLGDERREVTMPKKNSFDRVYKIGLTLPGVEQSTSYGARSLKVGGQLLACPAINKSAEPGSLAVRIDFDQRDGLLADDPDTYYLTDHYAPYPCVVVRLSRIDDSALRDLLGAAWKYVTSQNRARKRPARKRVTAGRSK
jgi:hypothetical protein